MHISDRIARACNQITKVYNYKTHPDLFPMVTEACEKYQVKESLIMKLLDIDLTRYNSKYVRIKEIQKEKCADILRTETVKKLCIPNQKEFPTDGIADLKNW